MDVNERHCPRAIITPVFFYHFQEQEFSFCIITDLLTDMVDRLPFLD